jgi:NADPH2:quinone reductase
LTVVSAPNRAVALGRIDPEKRSGIMLDRPRALASSKAAPDIPETMRAAAIDRFGGPEVLTIHTLPVPSIDPTEVLIAIDTAGVGPWDADIRGGWYPGRKPRFPLVLGTDGAGIVAAVGSRVRRLKRGDKVYAYSWMNPKGGFYAEYVAVAADNVAHIPKRLDLQHAGAIPATGLTALQGIDDALHVRKGENIVIHGASGGVGTMAVQFAKLRGARVLATASGKDGVKLVLDLGADAAIDGKRDDVVAAAQRFAPDGIDAVLAFAGGDALEKCLDTVKPGGRLAYPNGVEPEPRRRRNIHVTAYDAVSGVRELKKLTAAAEAAKLKVPIGGTFSLAQASKAHARIEKGHVLGKIVLRVRES